MIAVGSFGGRDAYRPTPNSLVLLEVAERKSEEIADDETGNQLPACPTDTEHLITDS
jgi:hypothetical protein